MRRRRKAPEETLPAESGGWALGSLGASANAVTVIRRTVWALVVAGPVLGVWALVSQPEAVLATPSPVLQERSPSGEASVGPGGFAELFVCAYLIAGSGTENTLAPFLPTAREVSLSADPGAQEVEQLATVKVHRVGAGYWSVTVAARVNPAGAVGANGKPASSGGGESSGVAAGVLRYFQVPVRAGEGGVLAATALPAEVGAPVLGAGAALAYGQSAPVSGKDPAGQTLSGFFSSFLAGTGDLDRYLSPGTALAAVSPAPYRQVEVTSLAETGTNDPGSAYAPDVAVADGSRRQLFVDVAATDPDGQRRPLAYALTIAARDGRWEIASVEAAPVLGSPSGSKQEGQGE